MKRPRNRPSPDRRNRWLVPACAMAATAGAAALLALSPSNRPAGTASAQMPRGRTPPRSATIELRARITTALPTQYETTLLLQDNQPFPLRLEYDAPKLQGYELQVRWRCDRGVLAHHDSQIQNRFTPPRRSSVSTIEAQLGLYPKLYGEAAKAPVLREKATLHVLTPSPGSLLRGGEIDGFRIGEYLDPNDPGVRQKYQTSWAAIHPEKFLLPRAFYLVDDASRDLRISRSLRLGDYALDYPWYTLGKRQYIALDYRLVQKVEDLIAELNRAGLPGDKFCIVYGFRPPAYNLRQMENDGTRALKAPFSFHQYGQAIDLILDADGDLRLDDLDGDGKVTVRDAGRLVHYVNALDRRYRGAGVPLYGGAGIYDRHDFWERPAQTPYVHIDVRGFLNEDGTLIRWPNTWPDTGEPIRWGDL